MATRRFGDPKTTWLVLVRATWHGEPLKISTVGSRCMYWSSKKVVFLSVIYQHLINLIMISSSSQASQFTVKPIMDRVWTPSYFMILEWHFPTEVVPPETIRAYDVCFNEPFYSCRELRMPKYFLLAKK